MTPPDHWDWQIAAIADDLRRTISGHHARHWRRSARDCAAAFAGAWNARCIAFSLRTQCRGAHGAMQARAAATAACQAIGGDVAAMEQRQAFASKLIDGASPPCAPPQDLATLRIDGSIGDDVTLAQITDWLATRDQSGITVILNSFGGDAAQGLAIYQALRTYRGQVVVIIKVAASSASLIAMAGDLIQVRPDARLMIHDCWSMAAGSAAVMREHARMLERLTAQYQAIYASRSRASRSQLRRWMQAPEGTWFDAQQAVAAGFADAVAAP